MIVRGVSFIIGTYPDEGLMYELLAHMEYSQVNTYFFHEGYIYLTSNLMLYGIFLVSNKLTIKATKRELEKEKKLEGNEHEKIGGEIDEQLLNLSSKSLERSISHSESKPDQLEKNTDVVIAEKI